MAGRRAAARRVGHHRLGRGVGLRAARRGLGARPARRADPRRHLERRGGAGLADRRARLADAGVVRDARRCWARGPGHAGPRRATGRRTSAAGGSASGSRCCPGRRRTRSAGSARTCPAAGCSGTAPGCWCSARRCWWSWSPRAPTGSGAGCRALPVVRVSIGVSRWCWRRSRCCPTWPGGWPARCARPTTRRVRRGAGGRRRARSPTATGRAGAAVSSYPAPEWNHDQTVLDPLGRYLTPDYVASDVLVVSGRVIAGEDPRMRDVEAALALPSAGGPQRRAGRPRHRRRGRRRHRHRARRRRWPARCCWTPWSSTVVALPGDDRARRRRPAGWWRWRSPGPRSSACSSLAVPGARRRSGARARHGDGTRVDRAASRRGIRSAPDFWEGITRGNTFSARSLRSWSAARWPAVDRRRPRDSRRPRRRSKSPVSVNSPVIDYGSEQLTELAPLGRSVDSSRVLGRRCASPCSAASDHRANDRLRVLPGEGVAHARARPRPAGARSASSSSSAPSAAVNSLAVVDEHARDAVDDRLAGAARRPVGHRRGGVHPGLADDQAPALLQRRQRQQPRTARRPRACAPRSTCPSKTTVSPAPRRCGVRVQLGLPPARAHDVQPQVRELARAARGRRRWRARPACAAPAGRRRRSIGVGDLPVLRRRRTGSVPLWTTAIRGPRRRRARAARRGSPARPRRTGSAR